jgi:DNA repair exonuclease SbcCD ATPase subunit
MKIIQLFAENVKRLSAVTIKPDGSTVVIGGMNGAGKSSVLDSIMYALAGGDSLPSKPLRNGTDKGQITVDIGEYVVTRKFARKDDDEVRSTLEIKTKEGFKATSPQAILDDLCGKMAFDPLEFSRLKPKAQLDALRELVGLDFTDLDRKRATIFDRRTDLNRQAKAKAAELDACPAVEAPAEEVSVAALTDELRKAQSTNNAKFLARREADKAEQDIGRIAAECKRTLREIEDLKQRLAEAEGELAGLEKARATAEEDAAKLKAEADAMPEIECDPIHERIKNAEGVNRMVRQNAKRADLKQTLADLEGDAQQLTEQISAIDKQKADKMAAAPFPVPGLGFDSQGVTFNGLPFSQASSAEQLRVSVAMGLALNPKLRVMLIRDGSLLDSASLAMVAQMAEEADGQIWLERVSEGDEVSVVIEDGHVKAVETAEATA